jgi:hypothetical protein
LLPTAIDLAFLQNRCSIADYGRAHSAFFISAISADRRT